MKYGHDDIEVVHVVGMTQIHIIESNDVILDGNIVERDSEVYNINNNALVKVILQKTQISFLACLLTLYAIWLDNIIFIVSSECVNLFFWIWLGACFVSQNSSYCAVHSGFCSLKKHC